MTKKIVQNTFTEIELENMQEVARIAASEKFKADMFEKNTAVLNSKNPQTLGRGAQIAEDQRNIANLMQRVYQEFMSAELQKRGYNSNQKVAFNLKTGEIKVLSQE